MPEFTRAGRDMVCRLCGTGLLIPRFNVPPWRDRMRVMRLAASAANERTWEERMRGPLVGLLLTFALVAGGGSALGHHSFAMFDQENPIELEGMVVEFKFTNPHTFILIEVKQKEGGTTTWNLEG